MKFESFNAESQLPNRNEAMQKIHGIQSETMQLGANDVETSSFQNIIAKLEQGELTPVEAIRMAEGIRDSKQDYH